jgi:Flp pilus assembly pilin Flp
VIRLPASIRKLGREERGATLVEFAMLTIPLFVTLFGLLDLGYMMYVRSTLQGVLNDVARIASVEKPVFTSQGTTVEEKIDAAIKDRMGVLIKNATYTIKKSSYYEFSRVDQPEKLVTDVNNNGMYDAGDCWQDGNRNGSFDAAGSSGDDGIGSADDIVYYHVKLTAARMFPMAGLIGLPANYEVNVKTTVRNQPFADQPDPPVEC